VGGVRGLEAAFLVQGPAQESPGDQGRVTYELILSSLQLFLKKLVFLRAILYNEAWEKNFMP